MYIDEELYTFHIVLTDEDFKKRTEMYKWCEEQWGKPQNLNKSSSWIYTSTNYGNNVFKFKNEADRNWFVLRFS